MKRSLLLCAGLLSLTGVLRAGDAATVDFEENRDSSGIVEQARRQGRLRYASPLAAIRGVDEDPSGVWSSPSSPGLPESDASPMPGVGTTGNLGLPAETGCERHPPSKDDPQGETPSLCVATSSPTVVRKSVAAPITGPYEPLPRDNPEYAESVQLRDRINGGVGKLAPVPPPVRDALLSRWNQLDARRSELIQAARPLDADDERLSAFAARLRLWSDRIWQRRAILEANLATYNRLCLGRPLPEDEFRQCNDYRIRFNKCVDAHNASVDERSRLVGIGQDGLRCLRSRGDAFRVQVTNWINLTVKPWIVDAKKALEEGDCEAVKSVNITPRNPPPLRAGGETLTLQGFPVHEEGKNPCPIKDWKWDKVNSEGDIGSLTDEESIARLVTGPNEAVGSVVLTVTDSKGNARERAVPVRVRASVETCRLEAGISHPHVKNVCAYLCPDGSRPAKPLDDYGIPDPSNPGDLMCRPFILFDPGS